MSFIRKFGRDTKAATAIEYGLIAALIAIAAIAALTSTGESLSNVFNSVSAGMSS